ncbi:MAG TPA: SRPBCC family protein [Actinomycetota bacterium]
MAERTEGSITIMADKATIMAEIADFESYPEWSSEIRAARVEERDAGGRAITVSYEVSAGPIQAKHTLAYSYAPDDGGVAWTFVKGSPIRNFEGEYVLEDDGDATLVTYRATIDPGIPMLGFLKRQAERKIIDTALKGLKKRVESTS